MPFAGAGLMSVADISSSVADKDEDKLKRAFRKFSPEQRERCCTLAAVEVAAAAEAAAAAAGAGVEAGADAGAGAGAGARDGAGAEPSLARSSPTKSGFWKSFKKYTTASKAVSSWGQK